MDPLDFYFKHPTTIQVSGPTRYGNTRFVRRILVEQLIQPFAILITWVYSEWQPDYDTIRERYPGIEFEKLWRDEIFDSLNPEQRNILVQVDQMGLASSSTSVAYRLTKGSHHLNLTVIYLEQNVYNQGKSQRTISLNSHYIVVFRNGRDASHIRFMAYQICPNDGKWLVGLFTDATSKPFGYLVLDHHPSRPKDQTVVNNILPGDQLTYYINSNAKVKRYYNILMCNLQSKLKRKSNKLKVVKQTIKIFSVTPDFNFEKAVINKAPYAVIGAISNEALNCRQGDVHISPHLILLFRRHIKRLQAPHQAPRTSTI